ncbi:MAG: HAMP domain-containing protein [Sphingomonadaceae bacterium]|nr:HAMP domain-containing protein [Sphingomonadaceae bacterium]
MNAHSTFLTESMFEEIHAVETGTDDAAARATPVGRATAWFNDQPFAVKFRVTVAISSATTTAVLAICLIGMWLASGAAGMAEARQIMWYSGLAAVALALTVALAGIGLFVRLREQTSGALNRLAHDMTRLANGERGLEISGLDRKDEIGEMARALNVFHKSGYKLDQLFLEREKAREERKQMLAQLSQQFSQSIGEVVASVAAASSQLKTTAKAMADAAESASDQSERVAGAMHEASNGATAAAAASDEFAMSIGEISRQAATSAELARKASDSADEADATISRLSSAADEVSQVVELIQTIARRTNLLALNASIEAARGGEAGRGFAVVASEVKELAAQTSRATEEVASQIRSMQSSTDASVNALRQVSAQISQLEATAISIASAVDQQSVAGQDLARSIDLAARSTDLVLGDVEGVRETALATGSAAAQVLSSATDLESQSTTLREQVDRFLNKVREG